MEPGRPPRSSGRPRRLPSARPTPAPRASSVTPRRRAPSRTPGRRHAAIDPSPGRFRTRSASAAHTPISSQPAIRRRAGSAGSGGPAPCSRRTWPARIPHEWPDSSRSGNRGGDARSSRGRGTRPRNVGTPDRACPGVSGRAAGSEARGRGGRAEERFRGGCPCPLIPRHHPRTRGDVHDVRHDRSFTAPRRGSRVNRSPASFRRRYDGHARAPESRPPGGRGRSARLSARAREMTTRAVPVVDLFAGAGGLAEGFSACRRPDGRRRYRVALSVEMNRSAHRTLRLRAFLHKFGREFPPEYYGFLNEEASAEPDWGRLYPRAVGRRRR